MKYILTVSVLWCGMLAALGQGTVNFVNRITGTLDAPVFDTDGVTRLAGSGYRARLYAGPTEGSLAPVGDSATFRTGVAAGYIDSSSGSAREIPTVPPNARSFIQVRAWDATAGGTFEAAQAAGARTGSSGVFSVITGGGLVPPAPLVGLRSFSLQRSSPPTIAAQPTSVTTGLGGTARFRVTAGGPPPFSYQWRKGALNLPGATADVLEFSSVTAANAGTYSVRVSNPFGFVDSNPVDLVLAPLPTISGVTIAPNPPVYGSALRLEVTVTGPGPFTYQWQLNHGNLPGATGSSLARSAAEAGTFSVKVTGPGGTVTRDVTTVLAQYVLTLSAPDGGTVNITPAQASYAGGTPVNLTATPAAGFAFGSWSGDLSGENPSATLVMDGHKTVTANFRPVGGTVNFVNLITGTLDAPVYDVDGTTGLDSAYVAQLYAGPTATTLAPVGPPVTFRGGVAAGYFLGDDRSIPSVTGGAQAFVQVRAWRTADGGTYEAAAAAGRKVGSSTIFPVITGNAGSPPTFPATLIGLTSFKLQVVRDWILTLTPSTGGTVDVNPVQATYAPGSVVELNARSAPGYVFHAWAGDLAGTDNPAHLAMDRDRTVSAVFRATGGTVNFVNRITGTLDAPIFEIDGTTALEGTAYVAQLYAGPTAETLAPTGDPLPFRTGVAAGYFTGDERSIPAVPAGSPVQIQVRAWRVSDGASYEAAVAASGHAGTSTTLTVVTGNVGSPPTLPAVLLGLESFQLRSGNPPAITSLLVGPPSNPFGGQSIRLEVLATGTGPLTYQWLLNGAEIPGATAAVFTSPAASPGTYRIRVRGPGGEASRDAVTVLEQFLLNLSVGNGGRVVPNPTTQGNVYPPGTTVEIRAEPEPGYEFFGWAGDLTLGANPATLVMNAPKTVLASFRPTGGTVNFVNLITGTLDAPVFGTDGTTRLAGTAYLAQLYAGPTSDALAPVGAAVPFRTAPGAGYFLGQERSIPTIQPGALAFAQVRAWAAADGSTFEAAALANGKIGLSAVFSITTGNLGTPPTLPATLVGLTSFQLAVVAPPQIVSLTSPSPILAGDTASLVVSATGTGPLGYHWFLGEPGDTTTPVGASSASFVSAPLTTSTPFWVRVSNVAGFVDSTVLRVVVARRPQSIAFAPPAAIVLGTGPITLSATASSDLPVTFARVSGPATLAGNVLTPTAAGTVRVRAVQPGNAIYLPAPELERDLAITKAPATVTLTELAQSFDGSPKQPTVEVTPAGLLVRLTYNGQPAAPIPQGEYVVVAIVDDPNYAGQATGTLRITAVVNIAGSVFNDLNSDGVRSGSEDGLAAVRIALLTLDGVTEVQATASDASGSYAFKGVATGSYYLRETNPAGFTSTTPDLRLISVSLPNVTEISFGDQPVGVVGGVVFEDTDGDGLRDEGEPGLAGVTIRLTGGGSTRATATVAGGGYQYADVTPGSYAVEEIDPAGFGSTTPNLRTVSVSPGGSATANFGDQAVGTLGGAVFADLDGSGAQEAGEAGLAGVTVRLTGNGFSIARETGPEGTFLFTDLTPGTYLLEEADPVGYASTTPNLRTLSLASGGSATASFGDQPVGSIGGLVFEDRDGNGSADPGEPGLAGVTIRLLGDSGQHITRTFGDGTYQFAEVIPGSYTVEETDLEGYSSTTANLRSVSLSSGGSATASFGDQAAGSIAGAVFSDANGNGLRESGEAGLGGVTLRLIGTDGTRSTTTSGDGSYQFPVLTPGGYTVEETDPVGFASTTPNLRAVSLVSGGAASASFGDQPIQTIAGVVFEDTNGNGQPDFGEPGIGGVQLRLLRTADESVVRETASSGDGRYAFLDVPAGAYIVRQTVPAAYTVLTTSGLPPTPSLHGGAPPPDFVLKPVQLGQNDAAVVNFGNNVAGQLSGVVFSDLDGNGAPSGSEPGLGGAIVDVRHAVTDALVASVATAGSGVYVVPGLPIGPYRVSQRAIAGYFTSAAAATANVTLSAGSAATANFPNLARGTVSGRAFSDENNDGLPGTAEPGMGGVLVTLRRAGSVPVGTVTSGDGTFLFTEVAPGALTLEQAPPPGFHATSSASLDLDLATGGALGAAFGNLSDSVRPPSITAEPADVATGEGTAAEFKVEATGTAPLEFQWTRDGTPLPDATAATLSLASVRLTDAGLYQVRIRNPLGAVVSRAARLTVTSADAFTSWANARNLPADARRPGDDPEGDHLPNLLEFVLGTDPMNPTTNGLPTFVELGLDGAGYVGFELNRARAATGVRLFLEASEDLVHWTEIASTLEVSLAGVTADVLWITDRAAITGHPHRFLRLGVAQNQPLAAPAKLTLLSAPPIATSFRLALEGTPATTYAVEYSTDLQNWTFLQDVTAGTAAVTVTDPTAAGAPVRFYRAVNR